MEQKRQKTCLLTTIRPTRSINDLPDVLLSEILSRVPYSYESFINCKLVCKLVCKLWNYLISCDDFASCFMTNHVVQGEHRKRFIVVQIKQHVPLCIKPESSWLRWPIPTRMSRWPVSISRCVSTVLGGSDSGEKESIRIVASHNDLLLCWLRRLQEGQFRSKWFVYNPFTMERVGLPPPPFAGLMGLMCEPCYVIDAQGRYHPQSLNQRWFKVVCVRYWEEQGMGKAVHFCSETGRWSDPVGMDYTFDRQRTNVVAYKGKFYWMGHAAGDHTQEHIVVYDSSGATGSTSHCFNFPKVEEWGWSEGANFGVCNGVLLVMRLYRCIRKDRPNPFAALALALYVWELKDDDGDVENLWRLEKCVFPDEMASEESWVLETIRNSVPIMLAFDPTNDDIVFMALPPFIVSCNLRTRNLAIHAKIPSDMILYPKIGDSVFLLTLPWWPRIS